MSFERIQEVITAEAEAEAKRIAEAARAGSDAVVSRAREENERVFEDSTRHAEAAAVRETARQVGLARHEGRLRVLDAKNRVLDDIFRAAAERIRSLPDGEYQALMAEWLKALPAEVGGVLRIGAQDGQRFSPAFLDSVNAGRPAGGKFAGVETDSRIEGGFVVMGSDYTVNATVENKINELRESLAGDLAKELFGS